MIAKVNKDKTKVLVLTANGKATVAELRNQKKTTPSGGWAIDRAVGNPFGFPPDAGESKPGETGPAKDNPAKDRPTPNADGPNPASNTTSCIVAKSDGGRAHKMQQACNVPTPKSCQDVYRLWCTFVNARLAQKSLTSSSVNCEDPEDALNGDVYFPERDGQPTDRCYNEQITPRIRTLEAAVGFDSDKFDGLGEEPSCKQAMITIVQNVRDAYPFMAF